MPSTAWNALVASGVVAVVYLGIRLGEVLSAIAAGAILFVGGWLTGYAVDRDPPIGLPRMLTAGGICGFVVVWTLLIRQGDYLVGGGVIGLVSFAAWFTSEMGPIKGDTDPMAPIDEPKPPAGPRPGTPVDLGDGQEPTEPADDRNDGPSVLTGLRAFLSPSAADAPEPPDSGTDGPDAEEIRDRPAEARDGPTYSTRRADPDRRPGGERESIFGLGIFYEGDPDGPTRAGASTSTSAEPKEGDHRRPGAVDGQCDGGERSNDADGDEGSEPAEPAPARRLREPLNSPRRPGKAPEVESVDPREGAATDAAESTGGASEEHPDNAEAVDDDEPPEEHRVRIEDEGGFVFG